MGQFYLNCELWSTLSLSDRSRAEAPTYKLVL